MAESQALSHPQLKATLWADASVRVHALILGRNVADLAKKLADADAAKDLDSYDCLWPGALSPERRRLAPYLLVLKQESAFTDWLLQEASTDFGDWGLLIRSDRTFLGLRSHCRALCQARLPSGQDIALDWMDPPVLRTLLPLANAHQIEELLAPLETVVMTGPTAWTFFSQQFGRLSTLQQPVLMPA
jgi:Domain of unknown function (DUF4123)